MVREFRLEFEKFEIMMIMIVLNSLVPRKEVVLGDQHHHQEQFEIKVFYISEDR